MPSPIDFSDELDPGWKFSPSSTQRGNQLVALRWVFLAFVGTVLILGVSVAPIVGNKHPTGPIVLPLTVIVAAGVASLIIQYVWQQRLDCSSRPALAEAFRSRLFLRLALAQAPSLIALAMCIALGPWWVYYIGLAFSLVGMWKFGPTVANIRRDSEQLWQSGCTESLLGALADGPTSSRVAGR